jgi:hypothetical protein
MSAVVRTYGHELVRLLSFANEILIRLSDDKLEALLVVQSHLMLTMYVHLLFLFGLPLINRKVVDLDDAFYI